VAATPADGRTLRIATRASELALWQAHHVAGLLRAAHPGLGVELVPLSTEGDRRTDVPLAEIGGKGVFATEVQAAVLDGRADLAVHSAKDLPAATPDGLAIAAVPPRGDPRDALVGAALGDLGEGDVVATGSARRRVQLAALVPGLGFADLRGNMATRLARAEGFAAIVVALVALERLGLGDRVADVLDPGAVVPQVGQGALAVECRAAEDGTLDLLAAIEDPASRRVVDCERAFLAELGGDCSLPAGAHATEQPDGSLRLDAVLAAAAPGSGPTAGPGAAPTATPGGGAPVPAPHRATAAGHDGRALGTLVARELRTRVEAPGP
jgi:hydroxymethylbilane synthase